MLCNNHKAFLRLWHETKSRILYNWRKPAQWLDLEEAPKHLQSQTCIKRKVTVPVWWSADGLVHYSFLNASETMTFEKYSQQINEMHQNLQCLQSAMVNRKGPILLHNTWLYVTQPMLQKLNELGYEVLPHWPYSPDLSPTDYHSFKNLDNFLQGKCFHNQQEAENAFQEFLISWSMDFYATGINKHFSLAKLCWL